MRHGSDVSNFAPADDVNAHQKWVTPAGAEVYARCDFCGERGVPLMRVAGRLSTFLRELQRPHAARAAARAERHSERTLRRERDNQETAERRAAAVEAERRRNYPTQGGMGPF